MIRDARTKLAGSNAHYDHYSFRYFAETQESLGVSRIELWGGVPHLWGDHEGFEDLGGIEAILKNRGLGVAAFAPRNYGYSLSEAPGGKLRSASLAYYRHCIEAAARLRAPCLCLSPGTGRRDLSRDRLWTWTRDALGELCDFARRKGVVIALGASGPGEYSVLGRLASLRQMWREVAADNLGLLLDTSLMGMRGETIGEWAESFGASIVFVRFSDGRSRGTRVWGEGCLPGARFLEQLACAGYEGPLCLRIAEDRYRRDPAEADRRNFASVAGLLRGGVA